MAGNDAAGKFFEALNASSDALIDAVRAANDRGHRVSTALIEDAQEGQRQAVELAKKWAAAPLDIPGFHDSLIETTTKAQGRALEFTLRWFGELAEAQKESREVLQRMVSANRRAGEATVDLARGMAGRAGEAVQSAAERNSRRATREPARSSEALTGEVEPSIEP